MVKNKNSKFVSTVVLCAFFQPRNVFTDEEKSVQMTEWTDDRSGEGVIRKTYYSVMSTYGCAIFTDCFKAF